MTHPDLGAGCPQCGSAANVHSVSELADLARMRMNQLQPGGAPGGAPGGPGYSAQPQAGPLPGYADTPQAGPLPGPGGRRGGGRGGGGRGGSRLPGLGDFATDAGDGIEQVIADVALGAAAKFIGRAVSRRVQKAYSERLGPALAARQDTVLQAQIEIAQRHPDLRACMTDQVIFLAGGARVAPLPNLATLTVPQADALVAQLRQ
jgi:hypothetical protein